MSKIDRPDAHFTLCHKIHVYCVHHQMFAKFSNGVKRKHYVSKELFTKTFSNFDFLSFRLMYLISCTRTDLLLWHKKLSLEIWLLESIIKYLVSNTWPNKCSNGCQLLSHFWVSLDWIMLNFVKSNSYPIEYHSKQWGFLLLVQDNGNIHRLWFS